MNWLHRHEWSEVRRKFNPPGASFSKLSGASEDTLLQLVYGCTVIELRCTCGDVKTCNFHGDVGKESTT